MRRQSKNRVKKIRGRPQKTTNKAVKEESSEWERIEKSPTKLWVYRACCAYIMCLQDNKNTIDTKIKNLISQSYRF